MSAAPARTFGYRSMIFLLVLLCMPVAVSAAPAVPRGTAADTSRQIMTGFPIVEQAWALSCEYAAASAATAYYGDTISQRTFLTAIGDDENPHKGFRGSIYGAWGGTTNYGVYAEPILAMLRQHGFVHAYIFYNDASTLRTEIAAGHPVVTWISGTWGMTSRSTHVDTAGDWYSLIAYEHAVTAYGYDDAGVWVMDPGVAEKYHISWAKFLRGWNAIDGMALVVAP